MTDEMKDLFRLQNKVILKHFEEGRSLTQAQARTLYGIERLSARISELRKKGYTIETRTVPCINRFGRKTHYAVYSIETGDVKGDLQC